MIATNLNAQNKILLFALILFWANLSQAKSYSYLALGDSYTIGEGVSSSEAWPNQLAKAMTKNGFSVDLPKIIAKTGWRTDNLIAAIEAENLNRKYDLVSILIGVNNQFQGKSIEIYKNDFRSILNIAINQCTHGNKGVFVLSIPDYGATPFGKLEREAIGKEISEWNNAAEIICTEFEIPFYNITPISKRAKDDASLLAKDELHPSGKMYSLWVDSIIDNVVGLLD